MKTPRVTRVLICAVMLFYVSAISIHAADETTLASFTSTARSDHVLVNWETNSQINTSGFFILRSTNKDFGYGRLTNGMVPVKGYPTVGASYSYKDYSVDQIMTTKYYYKLEEVFDNSAYTTVHPEVAGPVTFPSEDSGSAGAGGGCFIMTAVNSGP